LGDNSRDIEEEDAPPLEEEEEEEEEEEDASAELLGAGPFRANKASVRHST
jgi:hypothetical protein